MEETETPDPEYVQGFNEGYLISKHLPDLAGRMPNDLTGERGQGFQQGRLQFLNEKDKERLPAWLKGDRLKNISNQSPPIKGKKKDGPER